MSTHVAIVQTVGDLKTKSPLHKGLPGIFPTNCKEYGSEEEAKASHPGKLVMSLEKYQGYAKAMEHIYADVQKKKRWWKLW